MVFLGFYSRFGGQELETTVKTTTSHQRPRKTTKSTVKTKKKPENPTVFKLSLKIKNSWFLDFSA